MFKLKSAIAGSLFAISAMAATSAFAYTPGGYSAAGPGSTNLTYLGILIPCTGQFGIYVPTAGAPTAYIINTSTYPTKFHPGNALCSGVTPNGLTATTGWQIGAATEVSSGVWQAPVTGASVHVGFPAFANCTQLPTDTVTITINQNVTPHVASFAGTLHNGAVACTVNGTGLATGITAP